MARPTTKNDLVTAANKNFNMLLEAIEVLTEKELKTEFNFINDEKEERSSLET